MEQKQLPSLLWREAGRISSSSRLNGKLRQADNHIKPLKNKDRGMSQRQLFAAKAQHYRGPFNNEMSKISFRCTKRTLLFSAYILN